MNLSYPKSQINNPLEILRKAGYSPTMDPVTKEHSFMLRLANGLYPRFHLYLNDKPNDIEFSLHLDQKKASYSGSRKHGGEYDGPTVEKEMERIKGWIEYASDSVISSEQSESRDPQQNHQAEPGQASPENQTNLETSKEKPPKKKFGGIFG